MRMKSLATGVMLVVAALGLAATAAAQTPPGFVPPKRLPTQPEPNAIPLYSGTAPGSEGAKQ